MLNREHKLFSMSFPNDFQLSQATADDRMRYVRVANTAHVKESFPKLRTDERCMPLVVTDIVSQIYQEDPDLQVQGKNGEPWSPTLNGHDKYVGTAQSAIYNLQSTTNTLS